MKKNFNYKISYASETGLRERNEDAFFIGKNKTKQLLAVVCDGIGSDDESQIASHLTTEAFKRAFTKKIKVCNFYRFYNKCISTVSKQISRTSATKNIKMGTTIVCSLITGNKVECASMGDSRIYHYTKNDDKWNQVTVDQNLYNHIKQKFDIQRKLHPELLTQIDINEQMTLRQNKANLLALTKCLETGFTPSRSDSNYKSFAIDERDLVLLCSDGVYNWIKCPTITNIVDKANFSNVSKKIIAHAIKNGSNDNLTSILVELN